MLHRFRLIDRGLAGGSVGTVKFTSVNLPRSVKPALSHGSVSLPLKRFLAV